ncbi:MAG: hypothetical protein ACFE9S_19315 [Candidatus Hermodarchaeota archaeon]
MKTKNKLLIWLISTLILGFIGTIVGAIYLGSSWWIGSLVGLGIPTFLYIADNY